jgi:PKD repeat protein
VTDADSNTFPPDTRTLLVETAAQAAALNGPFFAVEGSTLAMRLYPDMAGIQGTWDFGDGNVEMGSLAMTHTYEQQGVYRVGVEIRGGKMPHTIEVQSTASIADSQPTAAIGSIHTADPLEFTFTDLSTSYDGIATRTWSFGDGSSAGDVPEILHRFPDPGTYEVTLTVTDQDGSESSTSRTVTANAAIPIGGIAAPVVALALLLAGWRAHRSIRMRSLAEAPRR